MGLKANDGGVNFNSEKWKVAGFKDVTPSKDRKN